ncbi:hypothetical protein GCM10010435_56580 [Winogradskya consettensis]|uniref:Uncharacterized protein n=1 Tax=Winogradskya consettensis TaxID=113560 RepID=A0A919VL10_9ACTN|nr:hypothetical protein Aco04nite_05740 [Actinoplanes consettensis]
MHRPAVSRRGVGGWGTGLRCPGRGGGSDLTVTRSYEAALLRVWGGWLWRAGELDLDEEAAVGVGDEAEGSVVGSDDGVDDG